MRRAVALGCVAILLAVAGAACGGSDSSGPVQVAEAPWERARAMSSRRSYVAAARIGSGIYVAGGMVGETGRPLVTFQRYDAPSDSWATLQRLPAPVRAAASASVGSTVYVVGGLDGRGRPQRSVWAYDTRGRSWEQRRPLPSPRFNHAAVAFAGRVYVLGGVAGGHELGDVFAYDPAVDRWTRAGSLPRPTHAFAAVAFRGALWVVGGRRGERVLDEVWRFDPATREWRPGPRLPEPMELLGAAVAGTEIHAVWEAVYQIYDARTGRWRRGPQPLVTRHALQAFFVGGSLYTIGGCTTALRDSPVVERRRLVPAS